MTRTCFGVMCQKHEICQHYDDLIGDDRMATCDKGDGKYPQFLSRIAPPPLIDKLAGTYVPENKVPVRNDGHKGIKSRGTLC